MNPLPPRVREPSHWLLGPAFHAMRKPLYWLPEWIRQHGSVFTIASLLGKATMIADPRLAREVLVDRYSKYQAKSEDYIVLRMLMGNGLVTSSGEFWRGQRKLSQPAFHRRRLDAIFSTMVERTTQCVENLALRAKDGAAIDMAPILSQLALDIISRAMFSSDVNTTAANISTHIAILNEYGPRLLRNPWLFLVPINIPTPFIRKEYRARATLLRIVTSIIEARRSQGESDQHDDLLAMLLSACDEETGRGMTDSQLRDEVMTIFIAGHETTANTMSWLLYLVAQHPEVREKLEAEIDGAWSGDGIALHNIAQFSYTRQVVEEALRIYPTIWSIGRRCGQEDELGGFRIPAGMNVIVPIFHFHWSEDYWSEPQRFDPDRFSPERRPPPEPMIYCPFGAGPRSCIGNQFALQELLIMTVILHRYFRFTVEPGFAAEPDPLITLRPKSGVRLLIEPREALSQVANRTCFPYSPTSPASAAV